jgi:hypothetical protein
VRQWSSRGKRRKIKKERKWGMVGQKVERRKKEMEKGCIFLKVQKRRNIGVRDGSRMPRFQGI